jgi:tRNA dimethylallyltransferase
VPHHLVGVADPRADFSVAEYVRRADEAIGAIGARGRLPIVVGGTGMYLRALLRGLVPARGRDAALRARLRGLAERFGSGRLHRWLAGLDPASARRIPPADTQRIVRALELALAGEATWGATLAGSGTWDSGIERYSCLKVGLALEREALNRRIDDRVDRFFDAGLVDEVRGLLAAGIPEDANAFKAIGYREVLVALRAGASPEAAREEVKRNTRRYAKRQRTWFRGEPGVVWLDAAAGPDAAADRIAELFAARA